MKFSSKTAALAAAAGILVVGAAVTAFKLSRSVSPVRLEPSPRPVANGGDPSIAIRDTGDIYLLRLEKGNLSYEISNDGGDIFGKGVRVNNVDREVVSHPEATPRLCLRGGKPYVLWQAHTGPGLESTKLRFARSTDYGRSFDNAIDVDPTGQPASQSFFTLNLSPDGTVYVVWLDGRDKPVGGHSDHGGAAIYIARSTDGGATFEKSVRVTTGACPCCRPSVAFTDNRTVHIAYRKVFENNIRDIAVVTSRDAGMTWGDAVRVADDHWQINGCPHSGPSLAVLGKRLFVSWFTVHDAEQQSYIYLAHSDDQGQSFSGRQWLSDGTVDPNHPYLVAANDRLFAVFQGRDREENSGWGKIRVYLREIDASGRVSSLVPVANVSASAVYPTAAFESPEKLFITWTEANDSASSIVLARGRLTGGGL
jgi:hypothetical protein